MNKEEILRLYNQDQRIDVEYPNMRREAFPQVVRHVDVSGNREGMVVYSLLNAI